MADKSLTSIRIEIFPLHINSNNPNQSNIITSVTIYEISSSEITSEQFQDFVIKLTNSYTHFYRIFIYNSVTTVWDISMVSASSSINILHVPSFRWLEGDFFINYIHQCKAMWGIEVSFLSGVVDNAANVIREMLAEKYGKAENVTSKTLFLGKGTLIDINSFYNSLIQKVEVSYLNDKYIQLNRPYTPLIVAPIVNMINLQIADTELGTLNKTRLWGFSKAQLQSIKEHFKDLNRNPTDIELEMFAQTWSEHCKHIIFNSPIDEIKEGIYNFYIKRATEEVRSKKDICISVFSDNAGAIIFDDEWAICAKVETHNSPSALEPFGGAITGILGVNRDVIGFGKGAKPIANNYAFCFTPPDYKASVFYDQQLSTPIISADKIIKGVIRGVNVGGNCSGIPTPQGLIYFDKEYLAKPLVFAGTIGLIPRVINNSPSHLKAPKIGDLIVVAGGRTGKDGIHGATFSSMALNHNSPSSAVQIGDPITQKKLTDALIKEIRDVGLYNAITDNGAGGFSSSIGEMGFRGFEVELDKVPLKYEGMLPWEIWISESQERMVLAVPPENIDKLAAIFHLHEVEFASIGYFNESGLGKIYYKEKCILEVNLNFLHKGNPLVALASEEIKDLTVPITTYSSIKDAISDINICSREFVIEQYDHTVQGTAFLGPLHNGIIDADATIIKPLPLSNKGVVQSQAIAVIKDKYDPYYLTEQTIDNAVRQAVTIGGNINNLALLDNFCWSDSYNPRKLWALKKATQACYDYSTALQIPFISGKDSMFNNFEGYDEFGIPVKLCDPPTVLITAIGIISEAEKICVSSDAKYPEDLIYVIGHSNLNGKVDKQKCAILYNVYYGALQEEIIASAICVYKGGIVVALSKTIMGGNLGADITLEEAEFYNSNVSKILITIDSKNQIKFQDYFKQVEYIYLGKITESKSLIINNKVEADTSSLLQCYKSFSNNYKLRL